VVQTGFNAATAALMGNPVFMASYTAASRFGLPIDEVYVLLKTFVLCFTLNLMTSMTGHDDRPRRHRGADDAP
jgi:hypothetical protein